MQRTLKLEPTNLAHVFHDQPASHLLACGSALCASSLPAAGLIAKGHGWQLCALFLGMLIWFNYFQRLAFGNENPRYLLWNVCLLLAIVWCVPLLCGHVNSQVNQRTLCSLESPQPKERITSIPRLTTLPAYKHRQSKALL